MKISVQKFRTVLFGLVFTLVSTGSAFLVADDTKTPALDKNNMDVSVRPGDDFYRYANGLWIKRFNLPDDRSSYDAFDQVREQNRDRLHALCQELAATPGRFQTGSPAQKIGDFYATAMDTETIEKLGYEPLQEELKRIAALSDVKSLLALLAEFHRNGLGALFGGGVMADLANSKATAYYLAQTGLGLSDRDYYTRDDADALRIRREYLIHIAKMMQLIGDSSQQAEQAAKTVMAIETRLAKASKTRVEMRDIPGLYNKMSITQLQSHCPQVDWTAYFQAIAGREIPEVVVMSPKFYKEMGLMLQEVPIADWRCYLRWHLTTFCADYLSSDFVNEDFRFFDQIMEGTKEIQERWKRMTNLTSDCLDEIMGQMYVEKYFPPAAKQRMAQMAANIKQALEARLKSVSWMGEETKKEALAKLAAMKVEVGYPDKWQDYSKLEVMRDGFLANIRRYGRFNFEKNMQEYDKPADHSKWDMPPQVVNAAYNPIFNRMVFPAGILQAPFFFMDADDAMNYGAIGMAIGHEMSHGFDDQGRNFDREGNLRDWWTQQDAAEFKKKTQVLVDQYSAFTAVGDVKVNGELALGESIADFAGLTIAYDAYRLSLAGKEPEPIDGLSGGQRFFLAFAQLWRGKIRDEALKRMVSEDVHPWGEFRVNGAPFNVPAFYELFQIKEGDKLYRKPEQRAVIW